MARFKVYCTGNGLSNMSINSFLRYLHDRSFPDEFRKILDEIVVDIPFDMYMKYAYKNQSAIIKNKYNDNTYYTEKTFLTAYSRPDK